MSAFTYAFSNPTLAWEQEVALGYGTGQEIGTDYNNHGFALNAKFYKMQVDPKLIATIDGTLAHWRADTTCHDELSTAAVSISLRGYFANPVKYQIRPYLGTSIGPAYLSSKQFGTREQGSHLALQITLESGIEIDRFDVNLHLAHYCNGGVFDPNQAINIPFILSFGYLF